MCLALVVKLLYVFLALLRTELCSFQLVDEISPEQ